MNFAEDGKQVIKQVIAIIKLDVMPPLPHHALCQED